MPRRLRDLTEPQLAGVMRRGAKAVEAELPPKTLYLILAFDSPALAQYISNCDRSTMVQALREAANRLEGREDVPRVAFPGER